MNKHASRRNFLWRCVLVPVAAAVSALLLAPAQAQQPVKIGFSMALTGPLAGAGGKIYLFSQGVAWEVPNRGSVNLTLHVAHYDHGIVTPSGSFLPPLAEWLHNGLFYGFGLCLYTQRMDLMVRYARHWPTRSPVRAA